MKKKLLVIMVMMFMMIVIVTPTSLAASKTGTQGLSGFVSIRGAAYTTTGGGTPAFTKVMKDVPKYRKIGKYYFGYDSNGLFYKKSRKGNKKYISKNAFCSGITDGKTVIYQNVYYYTDYSDSDTEIYKYNISKGTREYITDFYSSDGRSMSLVACYGNNLYFMKLIDRWYEDCGTTCDTLRYNMSTGELSTIKYNCAFGEQYGRYVTASRHDLHFNQNMNEIYDLKTGKFKKLCKSGYAILTKKKVYYYNYKANTLNSCTFKAKNKKIIKRFTGGGIVWMSDSYCGFLTDTKAYRINNKNGRKKKL